ncbi:MULTISPECIES: TetR/AcrR family transcriptional regulator [unclassified Yoonia]|uniref:TetR/AcrR family transcriptional regulator n=1 Tax=unclassified Yoonia TaxID=2629118 RepID=UPI002AFDF55C|nr:MULTISPECIES: TetR/AcrR family transcriptional regulator [unclassified Yoonia]
MPDGTVQPKKGRKFDQVLDGARQVFMSDGFEGASVDDIARAAGVSKATLYSYFPDKKFLFMQVAKTACQRQTQHAIETININAPARQVLRTIASEMVDFITSEFGTRVFRICVGESERFPELAREFYECGPMLIRERMADFFHLAMERGELQIDDVALAADQFHELCKADLFSRMVFSMAKTFTRVEKDRTIDGAVEMFMARYGVKP